MNKLSKNEELMITKFDKYVFGNGASNDFLIQIIESAGSYLNLLTISDYAKEHNLSYNGVKNNRDIIEIFNVKFVIDNN